MDKYYLYSGAGYASRRSGHQLIYDVHAATVKARNKEEALGIMLEYMKQECPQVSGYGNYSVAVTIIEKEWVEEHPACTF